MYVNIRTSNGNTNNHHNINNKHNDSGNDTIHNHTYHT